MPFIKYTATYFCRAAEIVCSVLHKWHLRFYLFPHSDFRFFPFVGYLHPEDYIKSVKNPFLNFGLNNLYHPMAKSLLRQIFTPAARLARAATFSSLVCANNNHNSRVHDDGSFSCRLCWWCKGSDISSFFAVKSVSKVCYRK